MFIIRLIQHTSGKPTPADGKYLVDCDVDARGGLGSLLYSRFPESAKRFESKNDAQKFWERQSGFKPTIDGLPNRPLTHFTIMVEDEPKKENAA